MYSSLDIGKIKKDMVTAYIHFIGWCSVVFKHFRVSLAACVIDNRLENSFCIDINKNIISYFNLL